MALNIQIEDEFLVKILLNLKKKNRSWDEAIRFLLIKSGILVGKREVQVRLGRRLRDYLLSKGEASVKAIKQYIIQELVDQSIPIEYLENQFVDEQLERAAIMIFHALLDGKKFIAIKFTVGDEEGDR